MSGIEAAAARTVARAGTKLIGNAQVRRHQRIVRHEARTLIPVTIARDFLDELDGPEALRLHRYVESADFEEVALQLVLGRMLRDEQWEKLKVSIREQLRRTLRNTVGLKPELLTTSADVFFDALTVAAVETCRQLGGEIDPAAAAVSAHLTAAAAANSELLLEVRNLAEVHTFADRLRAQVRALHAEIRLPHLGISRSVPYEQLYVEPVLNPYQERELPPDLSTLALPGRHSLILGDPGAGKSTLAAKLAHDVAADLVPGAEGRAPFLLVLRNFAGSFREGGRSLAYYLERVCRDPYNLEPPLAAVDYLLRNGRAVVLLDGLDELVEPQLRRNVVQLVDGFVSRYPLVPVLVTARRIGYSDAPLNHRLFTAGLVAELDETRIASYVTRWFALDESTPSNDRGRMVASFLAESAGIGELRGNPLLLALLCAMYSSEHYIPRNLSQVYERCAVMLFDRWDSMRGIPMPVQFHGRLRGAVQRLAWHMFNSAESGKVLSRSQITRLLAEYLISKKFDDDEAMVTAHQFVEFCTGRSWILTDVGATETEPRYGFAHRTFLEYFAAEHCVRANPSARSAWGVLRPKVLAGEWDVVSQIMLQLLDRNIDGGADELLRLVLAEPPQSSEQRAKLNGFAARSLDYVQPGHDVIRAVTSAALGSTLRVELAERFCYWAGPRQYAQLEEWDGALHTAMYGSNHPGNQAVVRRAITDILGPLLDAGDERAAYFTLHGLSRHFDTADEKAAQLWQQARRELQNKYDIVANRQYTNPFLAAASAGTWANLSYVAKRFGPHMLYLADMLLTGSRPSLVEQKLGSREPLPSDAATDVAELCTTLMSAPQPWIPGEVWWTQLDEMTDQGLSNRYTRLISDARWLGIPLAAGILLCLPYLETCRRAPGIQLPASPSVFKHLLKARTSANKPPALFRAMLEANLPDTVQNFLTAWTQRQINVISSPRWLRG